MIGPRYECTMISLSIGERQACANSVDPDQTLHNVASAHVYTVCHTPSIALDKPTDKEPCSNSKGSKVTS